MNNMNSDTSALISMNMDDQGRFWVSSHGAFPPLRLPTLPWSLHFWLCSLSESFEARHKRCLATLLILDCENGSWLRPRIPKQICEAGKSRWTTALETPLCARQRVAGSFQTMSLTESSPGLEAIPLFDGVHILQSRQSDSQPMVRGYVRFQNEIQPLHLHQMIVDDWEQAMAEARERMILDC